MKTLVLTGGGSAGHVVPNIALIPALWEKFNLVYIGSDGIERDLMKGRGVPYHTVHCTKLVRGSVLKNIAMPFRFLKSVSEAKRALAAAGADIVFSKGGYVALPVVLAAKKLKIPVLTHESDLTPGLANKIIARRCRAVLTSFPDTAKLFANGIYTGAPIRSELLRGDRTEALKKYGFSGKKPVLLLFGGGSGSLALNRAAEAALPEILQTFDFLHIHGKHAGAEKREGYVPLEYESDMASAYAAADFVVSRAGSNTVFELLALKKPALLVPLENRRSRGDQLQNAQYFEKRGLCRILRESDLSPHALLNGLRAVASDGKLKQNLAAAPFSAGNGSIAELICDTADK